MKMDASSGFQLMLNGGSNEEKEVKLGEEIDSSKVTTIE